MASSAGAVHPCHEAKKRAGRTAGHHAAFGRVHDVAALQQGWAGWLFKCDTVIPEDMNL